MPRSNYRLPKVPEMTIHRLSIYTLVIALILLFVKGINFA